MCSSGSNLPPVLQGQIFPLPNYSQEFPLAVPLTFNSETNGPLLLDRYLRAIFKGFEKNPEEGKTGESIIHCLKNAHPEYLSKCLCEFLNVFNPIPQCKIMTGPVDPSLEELTEAELRTQLKEEEFLSERYQQLTLALHKLPRTSTELTLQDFPLRFQRSFINKIRLFAGTSPQKINEVLSSSIYHRTIRIEHLKRYVSPIQFAFGQTSSTLADIFIEKGITFTAIDLTSLETHKLFWLIPALKAFSNDSLVYSMNILQRGFKENNSALVNAVFKLGHLSGYKFHYKITLTSFFHNAVSEENDAMIAVFRKYGFDFSEENSPLERAAKFGHFKRVTQLLMNNLHGQKNLEIIEKALKIANENQGSIFYDNFILTDENVDFKLTIETLTEFKESCLYNC